MPAYKYLIVGGGMTAEAAVKGIRELDAEGSIGVLSAEPHPPYDRPPLSKALWAGKDLDVIWRAPEGVPADWISGRTVEGLNAHEREVIDDRGTPYSYEKLLLATGGTPNKLPFGGDNIIYYRRLDDYERLRQLSQTKKHFAVIGGGFIGSEIAAALAMNGLEVVMAFPDVGIGGMVFPAQISRHLNEYYREKGVEVLAGRLVTGVEQRGERLLMTVRAAEGDEETSYEVDGVVAGVGIHPNDELAKAAGLEVDDGVVVDEHLLTTDKSVYAAGDVASFYNPLLDKRIRVEHEDNANAMGRLAGRNMAGAGEPYDYLPMFYSDLFEVGYEAVGEIDSSLDTVIDWQEPFQKGAIYYLSEGRVRGVLLWDIWGEVDAARTIIAEEGPFKPEDLKGRLPA